MLTHISINNFAIVEQLDLEMEMGLTVITGETGAGKSIMIDAIGLCMGDRADAGCVRHGADKADIIVQLDLHHNPSAQQWLHERELEADCEAIIRRVISSDGRSRAFINGKPVTLNDLREFGDLVIAIHGQHAHQALLNPDTHREQLDEFAGVTELTHALKQQFGRWQQADKNYREFRDNAQALQERADLIRFQLNDFDQLELKQGELAELEREHGRLANVDKLMDACHAALQYIIDAEEESLLTRLHATQHELDKISGDSSVDSARDLLNSAHIHLEEAVDTLRHFANKLENNPERLYELDQRIGLAYQLARKHRITPDEIPAFHEKLIAELDKIDGGDDKLSQLEQLVSAEEQTYKKIAAEVSDARKRAALKLAKAITTQIKTLGMPGGQFEVSLKPRESQKPHPHGMEQIEFLVTANPGQPAKPLQKVASGGELSRISLAIQVTCAQQTKLGTLIFDEVDVGIGGGVAEIVGRLLRTLGGNRQVLCVTHQPQVAAQGHHHLHVQKELKKNSTSTTLKQLDTDEKVVEIARMLGGLELTEHTLKHAQEMVQKAQ